MLLVLAVGAAAAEGMVAVSAVCWLGIGSLFSYGVFHTTGTHQLRFGVLLTPAFWTTPINRGLMGGGGGEQQQQQRAEQRGERATAPPASPPVATVASEREDNL